MIHLEDDFFEDPYSVRSIALKSKYCPAYDYTWPGYRCWSVPDDVSYQIRSRVRSAVGDSSLDFMHAKVNNHQQRVYPNSSFQYTTEEFGDGLFHHDEDLYICIVYLSLDIPSDSGTEICDGDQGPAYLLDNAPSFSEVSQLKLSFIEDPSNLIKRYRYARVRRKLNLHTMMVMKNIRTKKHLKVLLIIWKDDILKLIVNGKEKKFHNINLIQSVKFVKDID
mgnify:CR=1 FL=1